MPQVIDFRELATRAGIHFMGQQPMAMDTSVAHNFELAMDAQPGLVTVSNSGIPAFLTTYIDPKMIEVLVAVLVMGIGLLGVAAMQATALRNNQSALERTQATIQTYSILDAMRANRQRASAS